MLRDEWLLRGRYFPPSYWVGHGPFLRFLIKELEPKLFVELGVEWGFSYFLACDVVKDLRLSTKAVAVDNWAGDQHVGELEDEVYSTVVSRNSEYAYFSELIKSDFSAALHNFSTCSIDLLHIDGTHTYEAVKTDFYSYLPKLTQDAIVLLHDISVQKDDFGVFRFWKELKSVYEFMEFPHSSGLGVIFLGNSKSIFLSKFSCEVSEFDIISVFATLGDSFFRENYLNVLTQDKEQLTQDKEQLTQDKEQLTQDKEQLTQDKEQLNWDLTEQSRLISTILASKSWRLTKPLRFLFVLIDRFKIFLLHLPPRSSRPISR
jgi:hypothetical protein